MIRDFFLGSIKVHVLHHAAEAPVYGARLIARLAEHGTAERHDKLVDELLGDESVHGGGARG
jgi:hypothetical protein